VRRGPACGPPGPGPPVPPRHALVGVAGPQNAWARVAYPGRRRGRLSPHAWPRAVPPLCSWGWPCALAARAGGPRGSRLAGRGGVQPHPAPTRSGRVRPGGGLPSSEGGRRGKTAGGVTKALARARASAQPGLAPDCLQPSLVPRSGFRPQVKPSVRVCRDKPAQCEGVQVSDSEGLAHHAGPESCASLGNGVREALTGERAGRVESPEIGLLLGADALRTRGRPHGPSRQGEGWADLAGSQTPSMHGNIVHGTREALRPALAIAARPAWCTTRTRP